MEDDKMQKMGWDGFTSCATAICCDERQSSHNAEGRGDRPTTGESYSQL